MISDKPIIESLLDTDFYKFTMGQVIFNNFPNINCKFKFKCRSDFSLAKHADEVNEQIQHLCTLRFTDIELKYLESLPFFNKSYIEHLRLFQYNKNYINVSIKDNQLSVETDGPWLYTSPFETQVLPIIQEVYTKNEFKTNEKDFSGYKIGKEKLQEKIKSADLFFKNRRVFSFSDFGTRRRFNRFWHSEVVNTLMNNLSSKCFIGTSNVKFAMDLNLKPIGTMAHEYLQAGQVLTNPIDSQKYMLQTWANTFRGNLGIALSDVLGFDAFLKDFDKYFCKLYDGCRHDSGNPFDWGEKLIKHYKKMGINPATKQAIFSDGLNFPLIFKLVEAFHSRINVSFGVGTDLTNDLGYPALQLVMKMVECNGNPVAKISDSKGKGMCEDLEYLAYLKKIFNITK